MLLYKCLSERCRLWQNKSKRVGGRKTILGKGTAWFIQWLCIHVLVLPTFNSVFVKYGIRDEIVNLPQVYRRKKGRRLWEDSYSWYTWLIIFSMLSWRFPPPHTLKFLYQWYLWFIFVFHFFYLFLLKLTDICSVRMFPFCRRNINFMFFYNKI